MSYIGNSPTSGAFKKLDNIGGAFNGATTTFTLAVGGLPERAGTAQNLIISLGGVVQEPGVAYSISGTTITFQEAPLPGDDFFGVLLGSVGEVQTVTDGQITAAKIAAGAVTAGAVVVTPSGNIESTNLQQVLQELDNEKQVTLSSGVNIKTINNESIIGSGDLTISGAPGFIIMQQGVI